MATVLLVWELGGGLGHLTRLSPIVDQLRAHGHRVVAAVKEPGLSNPILAKLDIHCLPAPPRQANSVPRIEPLRTFAHVLYNTGFADPEGLFAMAEAWLDIYRRVRPNLILFDHSPTALLASHAFDAERAVIGTGFCCPPDVYPLPDFRPWYQVTAQELLRLRAEEDFVLDNLNHVLEKWKLPVRKRLSELYSQADQTFLTTLRELDHYPNRPNAEYWGVWPAPGGQGPSWPAGTGKRIFAYLKPFPALADLLQLLEQSGCPTLAYIPSLDDELRDRFQSTSIRLENRRVDLSEAAKECDLAILNGGHGTTVSMLLAGKPILQVPLYVEQVLTSIAVVRLGAGLTVQSPTIEQLSAKLTTLINTDRHAQAARQFAARYADFEPSHQIQEIVTRLESML